MAAVSPAVSSFVAGKMDQGAELGRDAVEAGAVAGGLSEASRPAYEVLRKRADFVAASQARRQGTPGFLLQARKRPLPEGSEGPPPSGIRVGFTCSKKVGNAVARNRAKRRLREIARMVISTEGRQGWDYVLVGRKDDTASRDFQLLLADLRGALARVHR